MVAKPLLLDLAYGRAGTFVGKEQSDLPGRINVTFRPLNSAWGKKVIANVPEMALRPITLAHPYLPKEGVMVLLAGTLGDAPVMKYLDLMRGEVFDLIADMEARRKTADARNAINERKLQASTEEVLHQRTDELDKLAKTIPTQQPMFKRGAYRSPGPLQNDG